MITGISEFGFFVQEWPFRDAELFFKNYSAETPILECFLGGAFWAKSSKKGNFGHPPKKKAKNWLTTEKLIFW